MTRLALVEKGVDFERRPVDISEREEQFEPWYLALNPKGVVPTLAIGDEVIVDTLRIVDHVDEAFDGPSLRPEDPELRAQMDAWKRDIMALHYGVLLYSGELGADRVHPRIAARGRMLEALTESRPELAELLAPRIAGNRRFQATLADPAAVAEHIEDARRIVERLEQALGSRLYLVGEAYSLADAFATAALARFEFHGYASWWGGDAPSSRTAVARYLARMKERPSFAAAEVDSR